ncbi:hypothetical protein BV20DRAFT_983267 [Pilatotrama ljubarskyi]|nr:hypothetical protein BV20DRAFT_983267 [Pilatotrama ljubarskyi]
MPPLQFLELVELDVVILAVLFDQVAIDAGIVDDLPGPVVVKTLDPLEELRAKARTPSSGHLLGTEEEPFDTNRGCRDGENVEGYPGKRWNKGVMTYRPPLASVGPLLDLHSGVSEVSIELRQLSQPVPPGNVTSAGTPVGVPDRTSSDASEFLELRRL